MGFQNMPWFLHQSFSMEPHKIVDLSLIYLIKLNIHKNQHFSPVATYELGNVTQKYSLKTCHVLGTAC